MNEITRERRRKTDNWDRSAEKRCKRWIKKIDQIHSENSEQNKPKCNETTKSTHTFTQRQWFIYARACIICYNFVKFTELVDYYYAEREQTFNIDFDLTDTIRAIQSIHAQLLTLSRDARSVCISMLFLAVLFFFLSFIFLFSWMFFTIFWFWFLIETLLLLLYLFLSSSSIFPLDPLLRPLYGFCIKFSCLCPNIERLFTRTLNI